MFWLSEDEVHAATTAAAAAAQHGVHAAAQASYVARLVDLYFVQPSHTRRTCVAPLDVLCVHLAERVGRICHVYDLLDMRHFDTSAPRALERPVLLPAVLAVLTQRVVWAQCGVLLPSSRFDEWCGDALHKRMHSRVARLWTLALQYIALRARRALASKTAAATQSDMQDMLDVLLCATPRTMHERAAHTLACLLATQPGTDRALAAHVRTAVDACVSALQRCVYRTRKEDEHDVRARVHAQYASVAHVLPLVQRVCDAAAAAGGAPSPQLTPALRETLRASSADEVAVTCLFVCVQRACEACLAPQAAISRRSLTASARVLHRLHTALLATLARAPLRNTHLQRLLDACAHVARACAQHASGARLTTTVQRMRTLSRRHYVEATPAALQRVIAARAGVACMHTTQAQHGAPHCCVSAATHDGVTGDALQRFAALHRTRKAPACDKGSAEALTTPSSSSACDNGCRDSAQRAAQRAVTVWRPGPRTTVLSLARSDDDDARSVDVHLVSDAEQQARRRIFASLYTT